MEISNLDFHYKMEGIPQKNFFDIMHSQNNIFGDEAKTMFEQTSDKNNRHTGVLGVRYTLAMLIIADARMDLNGLFRL